MPVRAFRNAGVALIAAATLTAPLAGVTTAAAVGRTRPVIALGTDAGRGVLLSPNGDGSKDDAHVRFTLAERSNVVVTIRRNDRARTVVYRKKLGTLTGGGHTWAWRGRNLHGKVLHDGRYFAVFFADQVAQGGKTGRRPASIYVDTHFNAQWTPKLSNPTVYPHTTVIQDYIEIHLDNLYDDPMTTLGRIVWTVKDARGRVVRTSPPIEYHPDYTYPHGVPLGFAGLDSKNKHPLPAGAYRLRYKVWDLAGNPGGSKAVTVHVSDKPLVEATGSIVVPPTGDSKRSALGAGSSASARPTAVRDVRSSRFGGDDPQPVPCGAVVPSEVYPDPAAMSFRSADTCGGGLRPSVASASGYLTLTLTPQAAPRGLSSTWLAMRGKPTVTGESDTARLFVNGIGYSFDASRPDAASAPVAGETVTTTPPATYPWEDSVFGIYTRSLGWSIATVGTDSYDVADITVHYTYLTPQS
jgi:hypothetical protein